MKIKYFDRAIEWLFLALMFIIPTIFDRRIGIVFSGTKSATLRIFILVILTLWAFKLLLGGKHISRRTILDWPIIAYMLTASAATILAIHPINSFFGFYGRYEGLVTWYCYALMFFITINYFRGFGKLKQLVAVIAPTAATMSLYGILQRHAADPYVWGGVNTFARVIATIGQPNFLSAYVCMAFFVLMFFLLTSNPDKKEEPVPIQTEKKKKNEKSIKTQNIDWTRQFENIIPAIYFILTPILFLIMIYSQSGQNIFTWYLLFFAMAVTAVMFALTYHKLNELVFKILIGLSVILIYVCNFYTQSRGGFLGLGVGIVLMITLLPRQRIIKHWKELTILGLAILLVTIITSVNPDTSPFHRFSGEINGGKGVEQVQATNQQKDSSSSVEFGGAAGSRGETWKSAFGIVADNPLFGIGPENLKMVFPRYETNLFRFKEAFHVKQDRCHNESFDVPVTKGYLTYFIYIFILFSVFKFGIQKLKTVNDDKKVLIALSLAAMASYIIQNQFSFGVIAITSLFWVLWAIVINIDSEPNQQDEKKITFDDIPWLPVGIILIVLCFLIFLSILQFEGDKYFKTGKTYMDMRRFSEALPFFKQALDWYPYEGGTVTNYGITLLNYSMGLQGPEQAKQLDAALQMFDYGMKTDPYNADNFYISSRIYLMRGDIARAVEFSQKTIKIDPYYAEAFITLANIADKAGNHDVAQKYFDEAYRINPNLSESKLRVAEMLLAQGKLDDAFNIYQDMLGSDPKNPAVHNGLAVIYSKRGQKDRAQEELTAAKSLLGK